MNEQEEQLLQAAVTAGKFVYWVSPHTGRVFKIKCVVRHSDEPGLVAYLAGGIPGAYIALYNCDVCDFFLMSPLFPEDAAQLPNEAGGNPCGSGTAAALLETAHIPRQV